ncbi:MAG: alpha/beta hydrolase [Corynebacteriales bacterium]|nr:alpha/beta hydrolase [Mycobacteriales bacterium]
MTTDTTEMFEELRIPVNGTTVGVALTGPPAAPPVLFVHGWPHTWEVWRPVGSALAANGYRAIAPDMRGVGGSDPAQGPIDVSITARDALGVLDALDLTSATVVAIDAGVPTAVYAASIDPSRVSRLIVMEGVLPGIAGAEEFLSSGPPWWFGFHAVPGLAERVVAGREEEYLGWFLTGPSVRHDIGAAARSAFVSAYRGIDALRAGFELYRATGRNAELLRESLSARRLTMPVWSVEGGVVGNALSSQLAGVTETLTRAPIDDCGHIVPLEKPDELVDVFLDAHRR